MIKYEWKSKKNPLGLYRLYWLIALAERSQFTLLNVHPSTLVVSLFELQFIPWLAGWEMGSIWLYIGKATTIIGTDLSQQRPKWLFALIGTFGIAIKCDQTCLGSHTVDLGPNYRSRCGCCRAAGGVKNCTTISILWLDQSQPSLKLIQSFF